MTERAETEHREADQTRRHARVAIACGVTVVAMLGLSFAAVPLYRLFCQATGYAGTTQRVAKPSSTVLDRTVTVRFDANVAPGLAWTVQPVSNTLEVKVGENTLAFYRATNNTAHKLTGTATFNVQPDLAGAYFNKVQCFCFTEQALAPGESADMAVSFFVDPRIDEDGDGRRVRTITLSYTFYPVEAPKHADAGPKGGEPRGG